MADDEEEFVGDDYAIDDSGVIDETIIDVQKTEDPLDSLRKHHPECTIHYSETILPKLQLTSFPPQGADGNHRSPPFLSQYEKTHILGKRANMLSQGARPFVAVPPHMTDVLEIAKLELEKRCIPFIICRTMPNGTHEMWRVSDLILLG
jgi:DNA-directed RNA polymerase subunit K/omega